jgi:hypothetical protein
MRPAPPDYKHRVDAWYQILLSGRMPTEIENDLSVNHDAMQYTNEVRRWNSQNTMCITTDGSIAIGPSKAR